MISAVAAVLPQDGCYVRFGCQLALLLKAAPGAVPRGTRAARRERFLAAAATAAAAVRVRVLGAADAVAGFHQGSLELLG